ncbi:hypothetical protein SprV_0100414900 [Sparganum proliferum]
MHPNVRYFGTLPCQHQPLLAPPSPIKNGGARGGYEGARRGCGRGFGGACNKTAPPGPTNEIKFTAVRCIGRTFYGQWQLWAHPSTWGLEVSARFECHRASSKNISVSIHGLSSARMAVEDIDR